MTASLVAPIFLVAPPESGEDVLLSALGRAGSLWHPRPASGSFLDSISELQVARRGHESHRLTAEDARGLGEEVREALAATLVDREGRAIEHATGEVRPLVGGRRLGLRIGLLDAIFADARFVYVHREPQESTTSMLAAWESGRFVSCPELPGWSGPPWSLPLIPGWRSLAGVSTAEIVIEQWRMLTEVMLDDLEALAPARWCVVDHGVLLAEPRAEVRRLCAFLDVAYDQALLTPLENARRTLAAQERVAAPPELAELLPRTAPAARRAREWIAPAPSIRPRGDAHSPASPMASRFTPSFPALLSQVGCSLLVSTYQSGQLICARAQEGQLNTHFRAFDKPMGIATHPGRMALGTRTEVWDFRDMPAVAPTLDPPGTHDACFLPRNRHYTGDIAIHEMAFAEGELWIVATAFSCLATLDAQHSFIPRWTPPFITALATEDRCHLNGLAVIDDRVAYVTALGRTDQPGGWRTAKASGGCLIDVRSAEIVAAHLSMPHSPRWHDGRMWVLESGRGELCTVDLDTGTTETVIELPGFTRGLTFAGDIALVGLSQIRESSTFGDLPLTHRLKERQSGVWMVDVKHGQVAGFLRFEDLVQEVFALAPLPGLRYPEIAEPGSTAVASSFTLP